MARRNCGSLLGAFGIVLVGILVLGGATPSRAQTCGDGAMTGGEACDDGNAVGGDGCAANCTLERDLTCTLAQGSQSVVQALFAIPTALTGQLVLTVGHTRADTPAQPVPFVIRVADAHLAPSVIPGIGLSCSAVGEIPGWGPGNAGGGSIDCGTTRLDGIDATVTVDSTAPAPTPVVERSGMGPAGSLAFELGLTSYAISAAVPFCVADPDTGPAEYGADAIPCTVDDQLRPPARAYVATSGTATARVLNPNGDTGSSLEATATGRPLDCGQLDSATTLSGVTLVAAGPQLGVAQLGDVAVAVTLVCEPTSIVPTATPRIIQTCVPTPTPTPTPPLGGTPTLAPSSTATPPATATSPVATATAEPTGPAASTATATALETAAPPTATATGVAAGCAGDCNGDRTVAIDELIRAVNIALGSTPIGQCQSIDANSDGSAGIEELIRAVNNALQGCPS